MKAQEIATAVVEPVTDVVADIVNTSTTIKNTGGMLTKLASRTGLLLQKHSPEILLVVGITSVVTAGVLACRATLKAEEVLDEHRATVEKIKEARDELDDEVYDSVKDYNRDMTIAYVQTAVKFVKLYGPPIALMTAGIGCIVGGQRILHKRNIALVAAYKAVEEGFNAYRERVKAEYGEDKDYMFRHGLREEEETVVTTDKNGNPKEEKVKRVVPTGAASCYARVFDSENPNWSPNRDYNLMFLRSQQTYLNQLLLAKGYVFLNDAYKILGFKETPEGQLVGWVISKDSDNYVDFGLYGAAEAKTTLEYMSEEKKGSIPLDFNVDGVVYDLI